MRSGWKGSRIHRAVVMFVIVNVAYFGYGAGYTVIKWTRTATSVACPWPYPEAKVYDPQGFYEQSGQPRPFFAGRWSTWMTGQPHGHPDVSPPIDGGRCGDAATRPGHGASTHSAYGPVASGEFG
ncbi:MAG TPA: spirocyclase AveC family protein [Mycobacterium sp.]|nr:spirocyclase AveC family protein [Mycobacterium sp.]